jgi:DNA-binding transcriptional ArsR family regulator
MVQYQSVSPSMDRTFSALGDPTRRAALERLGGGPATVTELARPAGITLTGMRKHLLVLEEAGLVRSRKVGRARRCELAPGRLDEARAWMDGYGKMLEGRFDRIEALLEETRGDSR